MTVDQKIAKNEAAKLSVPGTGSPMKDTAEEANKRKRVGQFRLERYFKHK